MATVTGDIAVNFSVLPPENPWSNTDYTGASDFKVDSGRLRSVSSGGIDIFRYNAAPAGTVIRAKAELLRSSSNFFDVDGPAILDSTDSGYWFFANGGQVILRVIANGVNSTNNLIVLNSQTFPSNSTFELLLDTSTGDLEVFINGTSVGTATDPTYSVGMQAGGVKAFDNTNAYGFTSFAADGYAPAKSLTITEASTTPDSTINFTTSGLGTITSWTATDSANNVLTLTGTDTTAVIPAFDTSDQQAQLFGTITIEVGDGTDTATDTIVLNQPIGSTTVTAAGLVATPTATDWTFAPSGGWLNEPADGDQMFYNDANITYNADGTTTFDPADLGASYTAVYYVIDATDSVLTKVTKNYLAGVPDITTDETRAEKRRKRAIRNKTYWMNGLLKPRNYENG